MLELSRVSLGYGPIQVVHDLSLTVPDGGIVALLGRNGAGKTTTLNGIYGLLRPVSGRVHFDGQLISKARVHTHAQRGIAYVPEGRGVLPGLSVKENLAVSAYAHGLNRRTTSAEIQRVTEHFPILRERFAQHAGTLSGGEHQMLVIARALINRPKLLIVDEPGLGLAPLIVQKLYEHILKLNREEGLAILLVEQYVDLALGVADHSYVLEKGRVVVDAGKDSIGDSAELIAAYVG